MKKKTNLVWCHTAMLDWTEPLSNNGLSRSFNKALLLTKFCGMLKILLRIGNVVVDTNSLGIDVDDNTLNYGHNDKIVLIRRLKW